MMTTVADAEGHRRPVLREGAKQTNNVDNERKAQELDSQITLNANELSNGRL